MKAYRGKWKNIHFPGGQLGWDRMRASSSHETQRCHKPSHSAIRYF